MFYKVFDPEAKKTFVFIAKANLVVKKLIFAVVFDNFSQKSL